MKVPATYFSNIEEFMSLSSSYDITFMFLSLQSNF